jgi:DNA-binding HxlR family transcriptional regulator
MQRLSSQLCPRFQTAMAILGKPWTGLLLQSLSKGPRRFSALHQELEVISERMLSARLKALAKEGIVERRVLPESPVRVEYRLTEKGEALNAVTREVERWAEAWVDAPKPSKGRTTARATRTRTPKR